eukprot:2469313-Amphidinium_carterae.1
MNEGAQADFPFVIDPVGRRTSFLFASAHLENELDAIYLQGTDVQKHPSRRSIVATRSDEELATRGEYMDHQNMAAVCIQRDTLNVSSTSLRAIMSRGKIPGVYGPKARALINPVVWRMQKALKEAQLAVSQAVSPHKRQVEEAGLGAGAPLSKSKKVTQASSSEVVLEKAMPAKARCKSAGLAPPRNTLPCDAVAPVATVLQPASNVPAQVQMDQVKTDEAKKEAVESDPQIMVSSQAILLKKSGVLKLSKPIFANLAVFWANCVTPLCALLHIQPYLMTRRNGGEAIRVAYRPAPAPKQALCVRLDVESFRDFRLALVQIGGQIVTLWYIAFDFTGLEDADLDRDTLRGMSVLSSIQKAVTNLNRTYELASTPVSFFMADVQQLVVISRPCYQVEPSDAAVDMQQILNTFFVDNKDLTLQYGASQPMSLTADPSRCRWFRQGGGSECTCQPTLACMHLPPSKVFQQGGMQRSATGRSSRSRSREATEPVLEDTVADLYFAHWKTPTEESGVQQRTVHVSVEDKRPVTIAVPATWSTQDVQWMLARHLALREGWLDFTWVQSDVHVVRSTSCPAMNDADKLLACGDSLPRKALTMNTFTNKLELSMGCCLHSKGRINVFSQTHGDLVRALANVVTDMVPDVVFNAMLLVVTPHHEIETQENFLFHVTAHEVVLVPYGDCSTSWIWFADSAGTDEIEAEGQVVLGSWIPFDKVICLTAASSFTLATPQDSGGLLLFKHAIEPTGDLTRELARLGFPLDEVDLQALDTPATQLPLGRSATLMSSSIGSHTPQQSEPCITGTQTVQGRARGTPIGAPRVKATPGLATGSGAPAAGSRVLPKTSPVTSARGSGGTTHFEDMVRRRLLAIEEKQDLIMDMLKKTHGAQGAAPSRRTEEPTTAIGGRPRAQATSAVNLPWRQGGAKRGRSHPAQEEQTVYVSPPSYAAHGLYAAGLFLARIEVNTEALMTLRQSVAYWLRHAATKGLDVAGKTLEIWAHESGSSLEEFLYYTDSSPYRAFVPLDAFIMALVLGTSIWLADDEEGLYMCSHFARPRFLVRSNADGHFYVTHLPAEMVVLGSCFAEWPTRLPLDLLSEPRTKAMRAAMSRHDRDTRMDVPLISQYFHTHLARLGAHMRLHLMVPAFNYVVVQPTDTAPEMTLILEGMVIRRSVPTWTSVARILVEIDTDSGDVDTMLDIYGSMDAVIHNRLEMLMSDLLEPVRLEYKQAAETVVFLLDKAMTHNVRIFGRLVHKFPFCVLGIGPDPRKTQRCTFNEFIHTCRVMGARAYPCYITDDKADFCSRLQNVPLVLVFKEEQIAGAKAAIRNCFNEELKEAAVVRDSDRQGTPLAREQANTAIVLSRTLPFVEEPAEEWREGDDYLNGQCESFRQGGGSSRQSSSTARPKKPAQQVAYTPIGKGLGIQGPGSHDGEFSSPDTVGLTTRRARSTQSSPVDDSFEDINIVSVEGVSPAPETCTAVSYVDRQAPFHIHMMTKSPAMGYRVHHPPQATIADIRHTMARRLRANVHRIVLAVGDGDGGEIPVHDTTVACNLGTLYMQLRKSKGGPYKRPAKCNQPEQDADEKGAIQEARKCSLRIPPSEQSSQTHLLHTTVIRPKVSGRGPSIAEFRVGHYDNTTVADILKAISRHLKVARERCHLYIEEDRRAYLHADLVIDNMKRMFLEVRGAALEDNLEKHQHRGAMKRPASSSAAPSPKQKHGRAAQESCHTVGLTRPQLLEIIQGQVSKVMEQLEALPGHLSESILAQQHSPLRVGGTRSFRVDQSAVARRAFTLITDDLCELGCRRIEPKLMETLCMRDRKCAVALFQAKSRHQRLAATAAALRRMGLHEVARDVESLGAHLNTQGDVDLGRELAAAADTGARGAGSGSPHAGSEVNLDLQRLIQRLDALEAWAHTLDSVAGDNVMAAESTGQAKSLLRTMARQALESESMARHSDIETRLTAAETKLANTGVVELASLKNQVDLCFRMYRRGLTGSPSAQVPSSPHIAQLTSHLDAQGYLMRAQSARIEHLSELSRMQTLAVSRTWNWVSALVHASPFAVWASQGATEGWPQPSDHASSPSPESGIRGISTPRTNTQTDATSAKTREGEAAGAHGDVTTLLLEHLVVAPEARGAVSPIQSSQLIGAGSTTRDANQSSEHSQFGTQDIAELEAHLEQLAM